MNAARKWTVGGLLAASLAAAHAEEAPAALRAGAADVIVVTARRDVYPELDAAALAARSLRLEEAVRAILAATLDAAR